MTDGLTYEDCGIIYELMDPHKRESIINAAQTDKWLKEKFGFSIVPWTRGESVILVEAPFGYLAFVVEGLGSKSRVADELNKMAKKGIKKKTYYDHLAQCNVAMALNDMITLGARPMLYGQYLAVGSSEWFNDSDRRRELIQGTKKACHLARCCWGGGETPTIKRIIYPDAVDLAGAAIGFIANKEQVINPVNIKHGDVIILIGSSGIHANGLTLAREIAEKEPLWRRLCRYAMPWVFKKQDWRLPEGYQTILEDGRTYGESLLDPTHIYVGLLESCLDQGIDIHYSVNITGHGWRKLMRAPQNFSYIIEEIPKPQPVFRLITQATKMHPKEAYGTFNMGAGFALYVPEAEADRIIKIAELHKFKAWRAGHIEEGDKKVVIKPLNIEFSENELNIR